MNKMFRTALVLAIFACASLLLIAPVSAQSVYGSIFGTVTDKTGAAIPGATVTVTDEAKGTVVTVTSNGSGDYSVPHLIPDTYDLKVVAKGFKTFETKGIAVQADTAPRIDPTLDVGGDTGTTVEVNADSQPELKTDRADVSTVFDQQQVSSLPVGDQNFTNLQLLLPGAQKLGWSHAAGRKSAGLAADSGGRPGLRRHGVRAGRHRQPGSDPGNHRHQPGHGRGDRNQDHHAELRRRVGQGCFSGCDRADHVGHQQLPRQRLRLPHRQCEPGARSIITQHGPSATFRIPPRAQEPLRRIDRRTGSSRTSSSSLATMKGSGKRSEPRPPTPCPPPC